MAVVFEKLDINVILDVGAHYGEFAELVRSTGYRSRIVSWEPVSENFEVLRQQRGRDHNWTVHNYALGASPVRAVMNVTKATDCSSLLNPSEYGRNQLRHKIEVTRTEEVEVKRLDQVIDQCVAGLDTPRLFLKLDTQGYDMQVLEGASGSIGRVLGIQTELSVQPIYDGMPTYLDMISMLTDLGFELSGLFPVGIDHELRLIEMDCVMVRSSDLPPVVGPLT
ncbi:MAG: FkbM family methyltransferase [Acidobacteria bacterium]|nr:FkbM family methyltransferase [Acidobacteriota bacterium]